MALTGKILRKAQFGENSSAPASAWSLSALLTATRTGLPALPQTLGDFAVQGDDAFLQIDDEDNDGGGFDGQFDLLEGGLDDDIAGFFAAQQAQAAGVHEGEGAPVPFGFGR